jgi:hypothetical protein
MFARCLVSIPHSGIRRVITFQDRNELRLPRNVEIECGDDRRRQILSPQIW